MQATGFRSFVALTLGLITAVNLGCGSDAEPETKAPPAPAKTKTKTTAAKTSPKAGVNIAQAAPGKSPTKKQESAASAKPKAAAPATEPKPEAKATTEPALPAVLEEKEPAARKADTDQPRGQVIRESFDKGPDGGLPEGWAQWTDLGGSIQLSAAKALSKPNAVALSGGSKISGRAWLKEAQPADVKVSSAVLVEQLIPAQVLVRGQSLDTTKPTFYAASVVRGVELKLQRVSQGAATTIAAVKSAKWLSDKWTRITLRVEGKQLAVQLIRLDTNEFLDDKGQWQPESAWAIRATDDKIGGKGQVGIGREASYAGTIVFDDFAAGKPGSDAPLPANPIKPAASTTAPAPARPRVEAPIVKVDAPPMPRPDVPRHYPHIRIALLAYHGNPMGAFEERLLRESVDLVVPDERFLERLSKVAPKTPSLVYTNTSSLYLDLLLDWMTYADRNGLSREAAFYHTRAATKFGGNSPSSLAVNRFWKVLTGGGTLTDHTSAAHTKNGRVPLDGSLYLGWPDRFREVDFELISGAAGGWKATLEHPSAVDETGKPTKWSALATVTDTTKSLAQSGQVTFDPPADWKPAIVQGDMRLYFVRFRSTGGGKAPVASTILGRDYVDAKGTTSGVIPAFDADADANKDGYLDDAEYAKRAPGKDARFAHESRMFTRSYGQMRFATNPAGPGFPAWGVDYHQRFLKRHPIAA
ncbi:MAG TPA: hypothetical protein VKE94_08190, partial [Gemmataceae bacterium]|nr:hypothetical protein [Gemmataceae bacterium]